MSTFKGDNLLAKSRSGNHAGRRRRRAALTAAALTLPLTISGIGLAIAWLPAGGATAATTKLTEVPRSVKVAQRHADHRGWHRTATGGSPSAPASRPSTPATQPSTPASQPSTPGTGGSGSGHWQGGSQPGGDGDEHGHEGSYGGSWQGGLPGGSCGSCDHGWGGSGDNGNSWASSGDNGNSWGSSGDHGGCGSCAHGWGWSHSPLAVSVIHQGWFRSWAAGAYLVSLTNTGVAPAQRVSVDIDLAPGVVPLRVRSQRWRCFVNLARGREICWYQGQLQPGLRAVLVLPERVDASPGGYLVGLANAGSGSAHRVSVDIGLARRLVPVCVGGNRRGGCSVHLPRSRRICSCRDLRLPWPAGGGGGGWCPQPFPGFYHPDGYLVSLPDAGAGYGQQVFADGDLARGWASGCGQQDGSPCYPGSSQGGGLCSCRGLLLPQLHTALVLPGRAAAPDGSFPVMRPADEPAAGVSPVGQDIDVTQIQPSS